MNAFQYRAATAAGGLRTGVLHGRDLQDVIDQLRREGLRPIDTRPAPRAPARASSPLPGRAVAKVFGELAVMIEAGIPLDRALSVVITGAPAGRTREAFAAVHARVREGAPLSQALSEAGGAFPPLAAAMSAAGEADGRPAAALSRLGEALRRSQALKEMLVSASVYPLILVLIATSVIGLMLFWVVPQFETLFSEDGGRLPFVTRAVLQVSRSAREGGLQGLALVTILSFGLWRLGRVASVRSAWDRRILKVPAVGALLAKSELARFFRVLGSLAEGGVALPEALSIAKRSLINSHLGAAVTRVATGLREGQELTGPLAATGILPQLAVSYLRTGEESAQLPLMLVRLADVLESDVRTGVERGVAILTPLITVGLGGVVATVVASIMTAILGFNDLALSQ